MKNNTDLIKQYKLEEAVKRIQKINEYTFYDSTMVEDDQDPNAMGGDPNAMGGNPNGGMPPMGGDPNAMGPDPNMMGGDPNGGMAPMDDPNMMGGEEIGRASCRERV